MLIINADDWGRSRTETDAALAGLRQRRVTSVSAMVFMSDSERAAGLAREHGVDVGLHLNLSQRYDGRDLRVDARGPQERIVRFMTASKYAVLVYHPGLRQQFRDTFRFQLEEFLRLYGAPPSHIDGHQHRHLCLNLLLDGIIPSGAVVRRNFSFERGEKGIINRAYRRWTDRRLSRRYRLTDYFFSLQWVLENMALDRVCQLSRRSVVELMTHPVKPVEFAALTSEQVGAGVADVQLGGFNALLLEARRRPATFSPGLARGSIL